jgi:glutamate--cysteine ligase
MSAPQKSGPSPLVTSVEDCVEWVLSGCKPASSFKIGTEFERFALGPDGLTLPYEGHASIRTILERMAERFGWTRYMEGGRPIALTRGMASISLEPAGQFELSGAPMATIADMRAELDAHLAELQAVTADLGVTLAHIGFNPINTVDDCQKMPKSRYGIMRRIMPMVGSLGLEMMHLTCTVQTNMDFSSEAEAMEMMRLGHLLSPVIIALFANSPIRHGQDSGYATFRAHLWTDVDNARCDVSQFVFNPQATVRDYVEWCWDVPMYFLDVAHEDGSHGHQELFDAPMTFRQFFLHGFNGRKPTLADWELHASTMFPDVRLKKYLELRQADVVPVEALPALPALTKGLFYDDDARRKCLKLLRDGDMTVDRKALRALACKDALDGVAGEWHLRELSAAILQIARESLAKQAAASGTDLNAAESLDILDAIVAGTRPQFWQTVRDRWLQNPQLGALSDWP